MASKPWQVRLDPLLFSDYVTQLQHSVLSTQLDAHKL